MIEVSPAEGAEIVGGAIDADHLDGGGSKPGMCSPDILLGMKSGIVEPLEALGADSLRTPHPDKGKFHFDPPPAAKRPIAV